MIATQFRSLGRGRAWSRPRAALLVLLLTLTAHLAAARASTLTEHMSIGCTQSTPLSLQCKYRLLDGGELQAVVAEWHDQTVTATLGARYPGAGDSTALLVLVEGRNSLATPANCRQRLPRINNTQRFIVFTMV